MTAESFVARQTAYSAADPSPLGTSINMSLTRVDVGNLFDTNYTKLCHSASRWLGGDHTAAEQVVQESFLLLWAGRHRVRPETAEAYLWKIAVNEARKVARRRSKEAQLVDRAARQGTLPGAGGSAVAAVEDVPERADMRQLVDALPWDQRVVVDLHYYLDWPDRKIAAHLGCPAVTVRARLHRARRALKAQLGEGAGR